DMRRDLPGTIFFALLFGLVGCSAIACVSYLISLNFSSFAQSTSKATFGGSVLFLHGWLQCEMYRYLAQHGMRTGYAAPSLAEHWWGGVGWVVTGSDRWILRCRIPMWEPILVLAGLMWWAALWRRRNRQKSQFACARCNYSLTGNVSGVCPECGGKISAVPM